MVTRRRTGFQDSPDSDEVSSMVADEESTSIADETPSIAPEVETEVAPKPEPVIAVEVVKPPRLLEKPKLPDKRRNVPRFSRIKP